MPQHTLLIIDDERDTRDQLQGVFISRGWEVAMAETQAGGESLLAGFEPDWVLVSWDQLGGTGRSFVEGLRTEMPGTRVGLLIGACCRNEAALIGRLAADAKFVKPVTPTAVYRYCSERLVAPVAVG